MRGLLFFFSILLSMNVYAGVTEQEKKTLATQALKLHSLENYKELSTHIDHVKKLMAETKALDRRVKELTKADDACYQNLEIILALSKAAEAHQKLWSINHKNIIHLIKTTHHLKLIIDHNDAKNIDRAIFEAAGLAYLALTQTVEKKEYYQNAIEYLETARQKYPSDDEHPPLNLLEALACARINLAKILVSDNDADSAMLMQNLLMAMGCCKQTVREHEVVSREFLQDAGDINAHIAELSRPVHNIAALEEALNMYIKAIGMLPPLSPNLITEKCTDFFYYTHNLSSLFPAALSCINSIFNHAENHAEILPKHLRALAAYFDPLFFDRTEQPEQDYDAVLLCAAAETYLMLYTYDRDESTLCKAKRCYRYYENKTGDSLFISRLITIGKMYNRLAGEADGKEKRDLYLRAAHFYGIGVIMAKKKVRSGLDFEDIPDAVELWDTALGNLLQLALTQEDEKREKFLDLARKFSDYPLVKSPLNTCLAERRHRLNKLNPLSEKERHERFIAAFDHFNNFLQDRLKYEQDLVKAVASFEVFFEHEKEVVIDGATYGTAGCAYFEYAMRTPLFMQAGLNKALTFFKIAAAKYALLRSEMPIQFLKTFATVSGVCAHNTNISENRCVIKLEQEFLETIALYETLFERTAVDELVHTDVSGAATLYFQLWVCSQNKEHLQRAVVLYIQAIAIIKKKIPDVIKAKKHIASNAYVVLKHSPDEVPADTFINAAHTQYCLGKDYSDNSARKKELYKAAYENFLIASWGHELDEFSDTTLTEYAYVSHWLYTHSNKSNDYFKSTLDLFSILVDRKILLPPSSYHDIAKFLYQEWKKTHDHYACDRAIDAYNRSINAYLIFLEQNMIEKSEVIKSGVFLSAGKALLERAVYMKAPLSDVKSAVYSFQSGLSLQPRNKTLQRALANAKRQIDVAQKDEIMMLLEISEDSEN